MNITERTIKMLKNLFKSKKKELINEIEYLKNMLQLTRESRDGWMCLFNEKVKEKNELKQELKVYKNAIAEAEKIFKADKEVLKKAYKLIQRLYKQNTELQEEQSILFQVLNNIACRWTPDKDNDGDFQKFHTGCGHTYLAKTSNEEYNYFSIENGTTAIFCPYCGKGVYVDKGDIANVNSNEE